MEKIENILARRVLFDGAEYALSIVTVGPGCRVAVRPFEGEVHSTSYHSGTVEVRTQSGDWWHSAADGMPVLKLV